MFRFICLTAHEHLMGDLVSKLASSTILIFPIFNISFNNSLFLNAHMITSCVNDTKNITTEMITIDMISLFNG